MYLYQTLSCIKYKIGFKVNSPIPSKDEISNGTPSKNATITVVSVPKILYVIVFKTCLLKLFIFF